jgi:hypothetical protein
MTLFEQRPIEIGDLPTELSNESALGMAVTSLANHLKHIDFESHMTGFRKRQKEAIDANRPQRLYYRAGQLLVRHADLQLVSSGEIFQPAY